MTIITGVCFLLISDGKQLFVEAHLIETFILCKRETPFANSVDPDKMPHYMFYHGLQGIIH